MIQVISFQSGSQRFIVLLTYVPVAVGVKTIPEGNVNCSLRRSTSAATTTAEDALQRDESRSVSVPRAMGPGTATHSSAASIKVPLVASPGW